MADLSVIISYIDFNGTSSFQRKTTRHWSLILMLCKTLELPFESFKAVSWRRGKITQRFNVIQDVEFPGSDLLDAGPPNTFAKSTLFEEPFNRCIGEALYRHAFLYHVTVYLFTVYLFKVFVNSKTQTGWFLRVPH